MAIKSHELWYTGKLIYSWSPCDLFITRQFATTRDTKLNPYTHKCRVWVCGTKQRITRGRCAITGTYSECKAYFKEHLKEYYMELQVFNNASSFGGTECLIDNKDDYYSYLKEREYKAMERDDESRFWRAGGAPWDAPGMSMRDFF